MKEVTVTALAQALSRAFESDEELVALKVIVILCGTGLLLTVACLSYGIDLSPGFF
jgi:hypothetical protein